MSSFDDLSALLKQFCDQGLPGCGCALARDGELIYEGYFGKADRENGIPVTESTIFRLASMTKVVVCTAALMLFERGKFLLNEPLYEYFPEYRRQKNPMLIKHAFTMAVGLPHANGDSPTGIAMREVQRKLKEQYGKYDLVTEIKAMAEVPPAFEPGTRWLYGYGHDLVAGLITVISGKPLGQFLKEEIFEPLGMNSTAYRYFDDMRSRMAVLYRAAEDGGLCAAAGSLDEFHEPDAKYESGGAGLFSNARDYLAFTQMLANGGVYRGRRVMGRKTIDLMRRNHLNEQQLKDFTYSYTAGYGYGLGVRTMIDPASGHSNSSLGEFGWTGAAGTYTAIDPSERFSIVYLHQLSPNREEYHHLRVRAAAYGCLK